MATSVEIFLFNERFNYCVLYILFGSVSPILIRYLLHTAVCHINNTPNISCVSPTVKSLQLIVETFKTHLKARIQKRHSNSLTELIAFNCITVQDILK